jgi:hypothetical protein
MAWATDGGVDGATDRVGIEVPLGNGEAGPDASATGDGGVNVAETVAVPPVTVRFAGRVLEKGTRQPLPAVVITIDGEAIGETDADGRFELSATVGSHDIGVQVSGREIVLRRVELRLDVMTEEQIFRLAVRRDGKPYATTVHASRPELPKIEFSGEEARQVPGASGDPLRVIGSMPGVVQIAWPAALYAVRGANPGNTGFFLDGIRVPALFHLALGPSAINPYLIEGVDFYPGGYPANYGPYVSGIIAAHTVAPPSDRIHAAADVTLYDAGGIMTAPWDGGSGTVAVAARYSYTGALFSALQTDTVFRYGDYQVRVDHPLGGGHATVFAFGSLDNLGWTNAGQAMEYGSLQFHRLDVRWRRSLAGGRLLAGVTVGADWTQSTLFDSPINVRALSAAPRLIYAREIGGLVDVELGAEATAQTFATAVPSFHTQMNDLGRSRNALTQATFATVSFRLGNRLVVAPGLRTDLFAEESTDSVFVEPRLDVLYRLSDTVAIKADGGRFAQMPSLPVSVPGFEAFGLADLGAQTSIGGSFGIQARAPQTVTFSVTGYYQKLRLTDVRDIDITAPNPTAPDYLVSRLGRAYGAEIMLRLADTGRLFGWLAYTLSWSLRADDSGIYGRSDWDERHVLNLVAGYRLPSGYSLGARFHLNTGRWAPVILSNGNYEQLPAYEQLDVRAERRFIFDRFMLDVYVDFANVTYDREVLQLTSVYDPMTQRASIEAESIQIILPTIGLHAQF